MISKISRSLVYAFDTFAAGGGDLCKIDIDIAQDTGLIPVLARICSIYLQSDYDGRRCFACLLDFRVLVRMIDLGGPDGTERVTHENIGRKPACSRLFFL